MTRVQSGTVAARPQPASTCVACGQNLPVRTVGRPARYCSNRCKLATRRRDTKPPLKERETAGQARSGAGRPLGTKGNKFPGPSPDTPEASGDDAETVADRRRRERERRNYSGLYLQWNHSKLKSVRGCRRAARDEVAGVTLSVSPDGTQLGRKGLNRCASVWACPVCEAVIRGVRAEDADKAITEHVRRGGMVLFVTFTVRHWHNHDLEDLIKVQVGQVWKGLLSGRKWARTNRGNLRNRLGVVGTIRVMEVTVGRVNGWHPHLHVAVLLGGRQDPKPKRGSGRKWDPAVREYFRPATADLTEFEAEWKTAWIDGVTAANADYRPSARDGVNFKRVYTVRDAAAIGKYISKVQGTDVTTDWSVGAELARGDVKQARAGNMKAMDVLFRLAALRGGQIGTDLPGWGSIEQLAALWAEYELTTKGGQNMAWSEGLKRAYDIGTDEDQTAADRQAVDAEDAGTALDHLVHLSARTQLDIGRKRVLVEVGEVARDAVRRRESPAAAVRALLESVGIDGKGVWEISYEDDAAKWKAVEEAAGGRAAESEDARARRRLQESLDLRTARTDRRRLVWGEDVIPSPDISRSSE